MSLIDVALLSEFTVGIMGVFALAWAAFSYAQVSNDVREIRDFLRDRRTGAPSDQGAPVRDIVYRYDLQELGNDRTNK